MHTCHKEYRIQRNHLVYESKLRLIRKFKPDYLCLIKIVQIGAVTKVVRCITFICSNTNFIPILV